MKVKITITTDAGVELEGEFVLAPKNAQKNTPKLIKSLQINNTFKGLSGGISLLISKGFLNSPKTTRNVFDELEKVEYFYSFKSVEKTLRVDYATKKKLLTRLKDGKKIQYVLRK